jgi:hypothetical protein
MKKNIGITIKVTDPKEDSLFTNGIRQNVILLQEVYEKCSNIGGSYIINTSNVDPELYKGTSWEKYSHLIINLEKAKDVCDIFVMCHGNMSLRQYEDCKKIGKKIVLQVLGAELSVFNECILFRPDRYGIYGKNPFISAVWVSPHFYERDKAFFEVRYGCSVDEAPYVWDSRFIDNDVRVLKNKNPSQRTEYSPVSNKKRISILEPNINLVKTSTIPIVISELFYRKNPDMIDKISAFGAKKLEKSLDMLDFVKNLNSYNDKKIFFENRYPVVWTLGSHSDILLSHQDKCELNYLYLDAAWLGYPVVHNSPMMKDLGWYYPENNAAIAMEHIEYIIRNFDNLEYPNNKYLNASRKFAYRYSVNNRDNIKKYELLINKLFS